MESYENFLARINSFENPVMTLPNERFTVNNSLKQKVDFFNKFRPFFGDTTVFDLSNNDKSRIESINDTLYKEAPECFGERLKGNTFHITLHDLSNSTEIANIGEDMFRNEIILLKYVNSGRIPNCEITFETNYIINMAGVSLVLALKPKTKNDYEKLIGLYGIADCVKTSPYPLTPHITLAYFRHEGFSAENSENLCRIVNKLNCERFDITVSTNELYYEKFTDMNSYHKVFSMGRKG